MFINLLFLVFLQSPTECLILTGSLKATHPQEMRVPHSNNWQMKLKWLAPEGSIVKVGDPVVRFDPSTLVNEIKQLEIQMIEIQEKEKQEGASQELKEEQAEFDLLQAETEYKKAEIDLAVPAKWVSPYQRDQEKLTGEKTKRALLEARKKLENTKKTRLDSLAKLKLERELAELSLERKKRSLEKLTLTSKFEGPVIHRLNPYDGSKISEGDIVRSSMVIAEVPSGEGLHIEAWANEVDIHRLKIGQSAVLHFDAIKDKTVRGHIASIGSNAEQKRRWGDDGYFQVMIKADQPMDSSLITGMSVQASIELHSDLKGIKIPLAKVINRGAFILVEGDPKTHYTLLGYDLFNAYLQKADTEDASHE